MNYEFKNFGDQLVFNISGDLQFEDHEKFGQILKSISDNRPSSCIFDLENMTSFDSAGIGMLMIAYQHSTKESWRMTVRNPIRQVRKLLEIVNRQDLLAERAA